MAKEIWKLDPSETNTYLKLALAAREINIDKQKLISTYGRTVSEANIRDREISKRLL